jgi:putative ABC transport system permease protein
MSSLVLDLRFALRTLLKNPVFTATAMLCLALGIGANAAIFSVLNAVILKPLPYQDPERLVVALGDLPGGRDTTFAPAEYLDLRRWSRTLEDTAAHRSFNVHMTDLEGPVRIRAESVSPQFFQVFGVRPVMGRWFLPQDDPAAEGVRSVILSYRCWQSRFGGASDVIGRSITLNGEPHIVVGVAPSSFRYPEDVEMWVRSYRYGLPEPPIHIAGELNEVRNLGYLQIVGRLEEGMTLDRANSEMKVIGTRLTEANENKEATGLTLQSLSVSLIGDVKPRILMLTAAVGLVLLIACGNVANLLLARATVREREIAVRAVLGASRSRLVRQLLTEALLLATLSGAFGLLLALWGVDVLIRFASADLPRAGEIGVDTWVLAFTMGISLLTGTVFGGLPALQTARTNLRAPLKEGGRSATGGKRSRGFRASLVVAEVALSLVLLCGAGLLIKSLVKLQSEETGFRPENLLVMRLNLLDSRYPEEQQQASFVREVTSRVRALPGVASTGVALALPFSGSAATMAYRVRGVETPPDGRPIAEYQVVTPDYFRTMGIPLLRGRFFTERDHGGAPPVMMINEAMAERHWPGEDPLGKRMSFGGEEESDYAEIVGVVGNVRHFRFDKPPQPEAYAPYDQDPWPFMALVVRTDADPLDMAEPVANEIRGVDPDQPVYSVGTMNEVLWSSTRQRRLVVELLGLFAAVAISLALVGIYGVVSFSVSQRIHEFGLRIALGAKRSEVLKLAMEWGLKLVFTGVAIGLAASYALTRFISGLLYGMSATDPLIYVSVALLLVGSAVTAALLPAHKASRVDPAVALRYE